MADPKPSDFEPMDDSDRLWKSNYSPSEFEFDDDELDADGNYIGSEAARLNQEAADDD